jgi:ribosomal protein S18 acetylase RimI-like enzyme
LTQTTAGNSPYLTGIITLNDPSSPNLATLHIEPLDHRQRDVAEALHAVLVRAHAQEAALLAHGGRATPPRSVDELQARPAFHLCALRGGALVGALSLEPDDEPGQLQIATLVVDPAHQRQGVARALLQDVVQRAAGAALSVTTTAANHPALALYGSLGFTVVRHGRMGEEGEAVVQLRRTPAAAPG